MELGSGWSSLVIGAAIARNAQEGNPARFRIFDPFPRDKLEPAIRRHGELSRTKAEQVLLEAFERLDANDIVFVDTTHVVNVGGDVDYLILDVLPRLSTGVLAHVHDIFLPYQYPRQWIEVEKRAYTEQHLLHAFLAFNDRFEVVFPAHAIARKYPERVRAVIPSFHDGVNPGAFWIRRSAGED